jgi:hypothetical protein
MVASVFLFSFQNAIGKWLARSYPVPIRCLASIAILLGHQNFFDLMLFCSIGLIGGVSQY